MQQSRLDQVFRTKKVKFRKPANSSASSGSRPRKGALISKGNGSSPSERGSLEEYLSRVSEDGGPGSAAVDGGETDPLAFALAPCCGKAVKSIVSYLDGDPGHKEAFSEKEVSQSLPGDSHRRTSAEVSLREATASTNDECSSPVRVNYNAVAGTVAYGQEDGHQLTQFANEFVSLLCSSTKVPESSPSSPLNGGLGVRGIKRNSSPTALHGTDHTERKKSRLCVKDIWVGDSSKLVTHCSPEKKARLSTSPRLKPRDLQPVLCSKGLVECMDAGTSDARLRPCCGEKRKGRDLYDVDGQQTTTGKLLGNAAILSVDQKEVSAPHESSRNVSAQVDAARKDHVHDNGTSGKDEKGKLLSGGKTPGRLQATYEGNLMESLSKLPEVGHGMVSAKLSILGQEEIAHTPLARINQRPASALKSKGCSWSYRNLMFSPGDEFWNEAIVLVDGIVSSKEDCNSALQHTNTDVGPESTKQKKLKCPEAMSTKFNGGPRSSGISIGPGHSRLRGNEDSEGHARAGALNSPMSQLYNPVAAIKGDQIPYGDATEFRAVPTEVESPLPVRHFNFNSQGTPSPDDNRLGLEMEATPKHFHLQGWMKRKVQIGDTEGARAFSIQEKIEREAQLPGHPVGAGHSIGETGLGLREKAPWDAIVGNTSSGSNNKPLTDLAPAADVDDLVQPAMEHVQHNITVEISKECRDISLNPNYAPEDGENQCPSVLKPCTSVNHSLDLTEWLPVNVSSVYAKKGLTRLYSWQVECLMLDGVLQGRNLVYSASTSAGKSLVAEVLMLRQIISTGKRAILVLPYVALCTEKAEHLEKLLEPLGKRVRSFFGTQGGSSLPKDTSLAVCTIEKANILINKLLEEGRLAEIGIIVIDELHMVGDEDRGYLLELMLTKLRYAAGEGPRASGSQAVNSPFMLSQSAGLQIVGMSATMSNVAAVADWLKAGLYETQFRPVPLEEFIKVGSVIYNMKMEVVRNIRKGADLGGRDPDHLVELCHEVVQEGHSVLVFCSSRKSCETSARHIAKLLSLHPKEQVLGASEAQAALEHLRKCPAGLDEILAETLPCGVAYHHAGLTAEEREVVESCFRHGTIRVLTATSTLAAGINLPARRVILRQPRIGLDYLDGTRYRQMTGRAGRAGLDTKGESVLICKPDEVKRMTNMILEGCQPLHSCLAEDKIGMTRALLEVVAGGIVQTAIDVERYVKCTLLSSTQPFEEVVRSAQDSLKWLCHQRFIEWDVKTQVYSTTPLGRAAFGSSLTPEESLVIFQDLAKAREGFVLASDLHLVYQVTPVYIELEPDWGVFYQRFIELSHIDQTVGDRVGVTEPFLMRMAHGGAAAVHMRARGTEKFRSPKGRNGPRPLAPRQPTRGTPLGGQIPVDQMLRVCRRFFVALMLSRLVQEISLTDICESFKVPRGTVQGLQERAGRFAGMVTVFCERLGWHDLEGLISKFQNRVSFGVKSEIVELTEIPFVKASRARALYKAGFRTLQAVAEATVAELAKAISDAYGWTAHDNARQHMQQKVQFSMAKKIKQGARRIVLDKAEEARIAAFAAFRALGVDVSSMDNPLPVISGAPSPSASNLQQGHLNYLTPKENENRVQHTLETTIIKHLNVPGGKLTNVEKKSNESNLQEERHVNNLTQTCLVDENGVEGQQQTSLPHHVSPDSKRVEKDHLGLFGGSDIAIASNEETVRPRKQRRESIDGGPINVDKMAGGFDEFFNKWQAAEEFAFDLHVTPQALDTPTPMYAMEGIAICWKKSPVYYASFLKGCSSAERSIQTQGSQELEMIECRWRRVASILSAKGTSKISWDVKSQMQVLNNAAIYIPQIKVRANAPQMVQDSKAVERKARHLSRIDLGEPYIDVRIAAWLLWPDEESSQHVTLEQEIKKRLPGEVAAAVSRASRWTNQMGRAAHNGCCRRVAQIWALHSAFWKLLITEGLKEPLLQLEMPLVKVLAQMERCRFGVNMDDCQQMKGLLEKKMKDLESVAYGHTGFNFSLSAPADVANVLYKHFKLPVPPGCNKGKNHPSTDKQAMDYLRNQHPIVEVIKEHRTVSKLLHGTLGSIMAWAKAAEPKEGDHIKTLYEISGRWLQTATATGRLAMEEPNLQCVEHAINFVLSEETPALDAHKFFKAGEFEVNARDVLVSSQESWVLISADYSQIEVRLMAHFSGDISLISLLSKSSGDLFRQIGAQWIGSTEAAVTDKQRDQTKRLVYGILYGMGVKALAEQLECSVAEATDKSEHFKLAFPRITSWLEQATERCRKSGYIKTLSGRKRFLDKITTGNRAEQSKAERQAVNSICQGSAADLIKIAMTKLHSAISRKCDCPALEGSADAVTHAKGCSDLFGRCRLLLQIHDELLLEADNNVVKESAALVRKCMEGAASLQVPLRVKIRTGKSWGTLQAYNELG